jgi:hypothetical protein
MFRVALPFTKNNLPSLKSFFTDLTSDFVSGTTRRRGHLQFHLFLSLDIRLSGNWACYEVLKLKQLKEKMTGPSSVSLEEAIHSLKPGVDARKEAIRGNERALKTWNKGCRTDEPESGLAN